MTNRLILISFTFNYCNRNKIIKKRYKIKLVKLNNYNYKIKNLVINFRIVKKTKIN